MRNTKYSIYDTETQYVIRNTEYVIFRFLYLCTCITFIYLLAFKIKTIVFWSTVLAKRKDRKTAMPPVCDGLQMDVVLC